MHRCAAVFRLQYLADIDQRHANRLGQRRISSVKRRRTATGAKRTANSACREAPRCGGDGDDEAALLAGRR